jgi:hypothetical protein
MSMQGDQTDRVVALVHQFFGDPFGGTPEETAAVEEWLAKAKAVAAANWARAHGQGPECLGSGRSGISDRPGAG